jgi:hypothetical protein
LQCRFDLAANGSHLLARGFYHHGRLAIKGKAFRIQSSEKLWISPQRPFYAIRQAPLPEFGCGRFQKNRWPLP